MQTGDQSGGNTGGDNGSDPVNPWDPSRFPRPERTIGDWPKPQRIGPSYYEYRNRFPKPAAPRQATLRDVAEEHGLDVSTLKITLETATHVNTGEALFDYFTYSDASGKTLYATRRPDGSMVFHNSWDAMTFTYGVHQTLPFMPELFATAAGNGAGLMGGSGLGSAARSGASALDDATSMVDDAANVGRGVAPVAENATALADDGTAALSKILSKSERLKIFGQRLKDGPAASNADEAFEILTRTLDDVEDAYSGVAKVANPGLKYQGRMYAPRADNITRLEDGSIHAVTAGNVIRILSDGTIRIFEKLKDGSAGRLLLEKLGAP